VRVLGIYFAVEHYESKSFLSPAAEMALVQQQKIAWSLCGRCARPTAHNPRTPLEKLMTKLSADIRRGQLPSAETATG